MRPFSVTLQLSNVGGVNKQCESTRLLPDRCHSNRIYCTCCFFAVKSVSTCTLVTFLQLLLPLFTVWPLSVFISPDGPVVLKRVLYNCPKPWFWCQYQASSGVLTNLQNFKVVLYIHSLATKVLGTPVQLVFNGCI